MVDYTSSFFTETDSRMEFYSLLHQGNKVGMSENNELGFFVCFVFPLSGKSGCCLKLLLCIIIKACSVQTSLKCPH